MERVQSAAKPDEMVATLRDNPMFAALSDEALATIAETIQSETRTQVTSTLRDVELFDGLDQEDLEHIQGISESVMAGEDEILFEEGDPGDAFFVVIRGTVELTKKSGSDQQRLALLRNGQAFGEMSLLNDAPRSATARCTEQTYLLTISREAFAELLGGDTLAVRILKSLSKALWATSVRLAAKETTRADGPREALADFNRLVRGQLLPRAFPRIRGYDVAASTLTHDRGDGAAAWDWFTLADGRPVFVVMKADKSGVSSAQQLSTVRLLLRDAARERHPDLGAMVSRVNAALASGWVDGLHEPVTCGMMALANGEVEWVRAGQAPGALLRADGTSSELTEGGPSLGAEVDFPYESHSVPLGAGDKLILFSEGPSHSLDSAKEVLGEDQTGSAKEALASLLGRIKSSDPGVEGIFDVTAALVTRTAPSPAMVQEPETEEPEAPEAPEPVAGPEDVVADEPIEVEPTESPGTAATAEADDSVDAGSIDVVWEEPEPEADPDEPSESDDASGEPGYGPPDYGSVRPDPQRKARESQGG